MRFKGWLNTIIKDTQKIINSGEKTLKFYEIYVWPAVENYIHSLRHFDKNNAACYVCGNSNKILLAPCWHSDGICEECLRTLIDNE